MSPIAQRAAARRKLLVDAAKSLVDTKFVDAIAAGNLFERVYLIEWARSKEEPPEKEFVEELEAAVERKMLELEYSVTAMRRPENFDELPPEQQWAIDKELGLLDWEGK